MTLSKKDLPVTLPEDIDLKVSGNPIMNLVAFRDLAYVIDKESNIVAIKL